MPSEERGRDFSQILSEDSNIRLAYINIAETSVFCVTMLDLCGSRYVLRGPFAGHPSPKPPEYIGI